MTYTHPVHSSGWVRATRLLICTPFTCALQRGLNPGYVVEFNPRLDSLSTQYERFEGIKVDLDDPRVLLRGVNDSAVEDLVEFEEQTLLGHTGYVLLGSGGDSEGERSDGGVWVSEGVVVRGRELANTGTDIKTDTTSSEMNATPGEIQPLRQTLQPLRQTLQLTFNCSFQFGSFESFSLACAIHCW